MTATLQQLADLVHGVIQGRGDLAISDARPLGAAEAGDITFVENDRYFTQLHSSKASAALVPPSFETNGLPVIRVADPLSAFIAVVRHLRGTTELPPQGIDARAYVHPTAQIGPDASVWPFASVGARVIVGARCRLHGGVVIGPNCKLGDDVTLFPNVVLYEGTELGDRVIVHANSVLGADGFGYRFQNGRHAKIPQMGRVLIGSDVEIGACTTIDRGTFEATSVGDGTKIDNLVQVAHNCRIGRHNLLVSQMGIAGSSTTGDYVVVAGQAGIRDHVHIGEGAMIGAKAGVTKDVPAGQHMLGAPATPEREQKRILMTLEKLPEIRRDVQKLKRHTGMADEQTAQAN